MNKVLIGVVLGAVLGVFDGATAWFTPEVRKDLLGIIIGSTFKGVIAGAAAGFFARKVKSTAAGVVFGLLVGLALAYAVAAMQGKYYFEIMLPGGTVGAILGWATQRYGGASSGSLRGAAVAAIAIALFSISAYAHDGAHKATTTSAAFEKLKSLAGTWEARALTPAGDKTTVVYRVTGAGSVVMETMFAGSAHEMINMYTLDGDTLVATHYCSAGNQPVLKLNAAKSTENELVFEYVTKTGKEVAYINGVRIRFAEDGKVQESWSSSEGPNVELYLNTRGDR